MTTTNTDFNTSLKWMEDNPDFYYGEQKVQSIETDYNSDGIKDGLFYFKASKLYKHSIFSLG